jgi:hypothetical protein
MYSVDLVNGWDNSSLRAVRHGVSACKFQAAWDLGSFVKILEDTYGLGDHQMQVLRLQETICRDVEISRYFAGKGKTIPGRATWSSH